MTQTSRCPRRSARGVAPAAVALVLASAAAAFAVSPAPMAYAPNVPPPIQGRGPDVLVAHLTTSRRTMNVAPGISYEYWTFNDVVPGPFIRALVGDTLEMHLANADTSGMPHNVDLHAVTGPGGGAAVTTADGGEEKIARFKLLHPGLFVYHCAVSPVGEHIANGMYGLILVQPRRGLPRVDREYYVMQSELYTTPPSDGQVPCSHRLLSLVRPAADGAHVAAAAPPRA